VLLLLYSSSSPCFLTAFPFVGGSCSSGGGGGGGGGGVGAKVGNAGIRLLCLFNLAPILANNHQMRHAFGFLKELVSFSIAKLF
jgi:hypothetical protein